MLYQAHPEEGRMIRRLNYGFIMGNQLFFELGDSPFKRLTERLAHALGEMEERKKERSQAWGRPRLPVALEKPPPPDASEIHALSL